MSPLRGRTVAITGAARGIGAAVAEEVVRRGGRVLIGDLDAEAVAATAARLGPAATSGPLDVTSDDSYSAWLALADVDALVSNAGVMWVGSFDEEPAGAGEKMMDVNFWGVVRGTRLVLPSMKARGRGHLVTVASVASYVVPKGEATYGASKHAVHGWLKAVREELRGSGIEVFVPGRVAVLLRLLALLPQRGRDVLYARMVPDQVRSGDKAKRAEYESKHVL